jgi:succinate dehydrogenase / fumarate reductase cytochrome b subunit
MELLKSVVGRKILMAITGQLMVLFVVVHLLGNSSIFIGPNGINSYAEHLHSLGPLVWVFRLGMLVLVLVHGIYGIMVSLENSAATPSNYALKNRKRATFSSETMIWTGLLIAIFVTYHILHFTARVTPDIVLSTDAQNRFDVFKMVTTSFSLPAIVAVYVGAMIVLFLHLKHGMQSFFQTMGWNNDRSLPVISRVGQVLAVIFLLGYSSIPVLILAQFIK